MPELTSAQRELVSIVSRWLRSVERATGEAAGSFAAILNDAASEPAPHVRGAWQLRIAPLSGFMSAQGLTAGEVAREVGYEEANTYGVLRSLEKSGLLEQVDHASPKRWRLIDAHRQNPTLRASHVIREGEWTTYGDLAAAVSGNVNQARSVARIASTNPAFANPHRVLSSGGKIHPDWHDGEGRGPEECERRLREEGVGFVDGQAQGARVDYEVIRERLRELDGAATREDGSPDMNAKAREIDDPALLIRRVAYRTKRLLDRIEDKDDPVAFVRIMAGHDRADLRRAMELIGGSPSD